MNSHIEIKRETEFYQGFIRLKMSISNKSPSVITDVTLDFIFEDDLLRIDHYEPTYEVRNGKVLLGNISGGTSKSIAVYFDPLMCTRGAEIECHVIYRDAQGIRNSVFMEKKLISVVCPIIKTDIDINVGRLKEYIEKLPSKDSKIYEIQHGFDISKLSSIAREVVEKHDVRHVRSLKTKDGKEWEIWYYGKTKVTRADIVIKVSISTEWHHIELFAATETAESLTGLLADFGRDLKHSIEFRASGKGNIINVSIRDSIIQRSNLLDLCSMDGTCPVNILVEDSVIQHSTLISERDEAKEERLIKEKEEQERLRRQQEENERLRKQKEELDRLQRQKEEEEFYKQKEEEEKRQRTQKEAEACLKQEMEEFRKQKDEEERKRREKEALERKQREEREQRLKENGKKARTEKESQEKLSKLIESEAKKKEHKGSQSTQTRLEQGRKRIHVIIGIIGIIVGIFVINTIASSISSNGYNENSSQLAGVSSSQSASVSSSQLASVQKSYFQETGYDSNIYSTFWENERYTSIKIGDKSYVPLKLDSKNRLSQLILDLGESFIMREGDYLDLDYGYTLKLKNIDVDDQKVWLEFDKGGEYVDDEIIDVGTSGSTWDVKLDDIQGEDNVTVLKVHVNNVFQDGVYSTAQINGLWGIDFQNAFIVIPGNELNGYKIVEANDNYISYKLPD